MLVSLKISNYQSHRDTVLNFHKGVNVITGNSDCGKTAILRALTWVITNKPTGEAFRSSWGGDTIVEAEFDDCVVERGRIGNKNSYMLNDQLFEAFKQDVPTPIAEAINMNEINMQAQLDAPFLLASSSSEVARTLNKIANLQNIDNAISNIRKSVLSNNREIVALEQQIAELEVEEKGFSYLQKFEKDVIKYDSFIEKHDKIDSDITDLFVVVKAAQNAQCVVDSFIDLSGVESEVNAALMLLDSAKGLETAIASFEKLLKMMSNAESKIDALTFDIEVKTEEFEKLMPARCPLCGK